MLRRIFIEEPTIPLPQPSEPQVNPQSFMILVMNGFPCQCPSQWAMQQWIYEQAYQKAQATVRPSIVERDLLGHWN
jgi:hypothetical protein